MVMDDADSWKILWGVFVSGAVGIISFFGARTIHKLDKVSDKTDQNNLDLANFKTDAANTYAKEVSIQQSLARIHDRMDHDLGEIRTDIKTLLQRGK